MYLKLIRTRFGGSVQQLLQAVEEYSRHFLSLQIHPMHVRDGASYMSLAARDVVTDAEGQSIVKHPYVKYPLLKQLV